MSAVLTSPNEVVRCLLMYTDWWQPFTTSVLQVGGARRKSNDATDFRSGLLETLDERGELARRVCQLRETDRHLLLMWYVQQLPTEDIAETLGISIRQCFRRRARAVRKIVELGEPQEAA
jgi:DNA-directed RNA polymerase specialized sigma24 family protein